MLKIDRFQIKNNYFHIMNVHQYERKTEHDSCPCGEFEVINLLFGRSGQTE